MDLVRFSRVIMALDARARACLQLANGGDLLAQVGVDAGAGSMRYRGMVMRGVRAQLGDDGVHLGLPP